MVSARTQLTVAASLTAAVTAAAVTPGCWWPIAILRLGSIASPTPSAATARAAATTLSHAAAGGLGRAGVGWDSAAGGTASGGVATAAISWSHRAVGGSPAAQPLPGESTRTPGSCDDPSKLGGTRPDAEAT